MGCGPTLFHSLFCTGKLSLLSLRKTPDWLWLTLLAPYTMANMAKSASLDGHSCYQPPLQLWDPIYSIGAKAKSSEETLEQVFIPYEKKPRKGNNLSFCLWTLSCEDVMFGAAAAFL